ncbi:MAG: hypothetical protein ACI857_002415 [Arenicella sp.]|jgi:hypothetical protein
MWDGQRLKFFLEIENEKDETIEFFTSNNILIKGLKLDSKEYQNMLKLLDKILELKKTPSNFIDFS